VLKILILGNKVIGNGQKYWYNR